MDNFTNADVAAQRAAYERRFAEMTPDEQEAQNRIIFATVVLMLKAQEAKTVNGAARLVDNSESVAHTEEEPAEDESVSS